MSYQMKYLLSSSDVLIAFPIKDLIEMFVQLAM